MGTSDRKQQEYAQREQLFLHLAREIINTQGINELTMEGIAANADYSKGTLYKHFSCKEDLLAGVCNDSLMKLVEAFKKAKEFPGLAREKAIAAFLAYRWHSQNHPEEFDMILASRNNPLMLEKARPERRKQHESIDNEVYCAFKAIIELACEEGNLSLNEILTTEQIYFGVWSQAFGIYTLSQAAVVNQTYKVPDIDTALFIQLSSLLDGYQWHPLSSEVNYLDVMVTAEAFLRKQLSPQQQT